MRKLEYQVTFNTPAFLGNADQQAQWRTPPFKALLRQWWRVVHAPKVGFDVDELRRGESRLFGVAADGGDSRRSLVRLRLSAWESGKLERWERDDRLPHLEVTDRQGEVKNIGAQLYLGYGPLTFGDTGRRNQQGRPISDTKLNQEPQRTAIADRASQELTVIVPQSDLDEIRRAMALAAWFGTLGSRSRNGWGALQIEAKGDTPSIPTLALAPLADVLRPLDQCLKLDWPHAIGTDERGPLVWRTGTVGSWREIMKELARIKIAFRTQPDLSLANVPEGRFAARHFLAYPITHHKVNGDAWGNKGRLANQMRFKVAKEDGQWRGVIAHLPCRLPEEMVAALPPHQQNNVDAMAPAAWQAVHKVLDQNANRVR
jgi:CRISPR-associated protein Cmr1